MAKIVTLKSPNDEDIYPVTDASGIRVTGNITLQQALDGFVYADNPTTPANPEAWITSRDVDWSTMPGSYSTTEQKTPFTWIDSKPIYKKTFSFTLANAESTTINHRISNFGLLIRFEGAVVQSGTKNVPIPRTLTNLNYQVGLEGVTTTSFEIDVGSSGPRGKQAYMTLWYTKTTD